MTSLRSALNRYVAMRRGLGHQFRAQERRLTDFVTFMEEHDATVITHKLALEWATLPPDRHASWALRLCDVRGFARHLLNVEPRTEVPPVKTLPPLRRAKPYLYTDEEIRKLLAAALELPPAAGLRRWTFHCLFGLLAVTGLRVGEALRLRREDTDLRQGVLTIRDTKFGKSRLAPVHATTQEALLGYAARRDEHPDRRGSPYFFVTERGRRLLIQYVHPVFWKLSRQIGLRSRDDHTGPRLHDFRHRFAVQTLVDWYRAGEDVKRLLPALSTYLGHSCVRDTYWYLSACPELMEHAAKRLEARWETLP
ncbi:MAG: tyrosine-type recombinase/integrase [Alphaproteobacteria bacterium]